MTTFTLPYVEDIPLHPENFWAMEWLREHWEASHALPEIEVDLSEATIRSDLIDGNLRPATLDNGRVDRSKTLFLAGLKLGRRGATREEIVATLRDLDEDQGFRKYSRRRDGGLKAYTAIAQAALPARRDGETDAPRRVSTPEASRKLFNVARGRPPEDERGKEPMPDCDHHYQGYVDECWPIHQRRRKAAMRDGAPDRLTGEIKTHLRYLLTNSRSADAEKDYISPYRVKLCISTENPHLNTPDLEALVVGYFGEKGSNGEEHPVVKRVRDCGAPCKWECDQHGVKMTGQAECRLHYCPHCLTDLGRDLDRARLPDINPKSGAAYRSVWLISKYPLPKNLPEWKGHLEALEKQYESALIKIQRRKASKGSVLWRSFAAYYTLNEAWIHWKVMVSEERPRGADDTVTELCRVMGAEVYDDRRYVHGELATLQLIENARTHLLGFSQDIDWEEKFELFAAHLEATRGKHIFQGMGALWALLRDLPEPEPLTCDECGARLHRVIEREPAPGQPPLGNIVPDRPHPRRTGGQGGAL